MKKIILSTSLVLICITLCMNANGRNGDEKWSFFPGSHAYGSPVFLPGEDTLKLSGDTVSHDSANSYFSYQNSCLAILSVSTGSLTQLDTLAGKLYSADLDFLYYSAKNQMSAGGIASNRFITALQITYGIRNQKIVLYYTPLCLIRNQQPPQKQGQQPPKTDSATYQDKSLINCPNLFFTYSGGNFVVANPLQFTIDTLNYRQFIRIRHHITDSTYGTFNNTANDTGDARSVIFPFQELYAVYNANNASGGNYIKFLNIGMRDSTNRIKHDLLVSPANLPPKSGSYANLTAVGFHNGYADMGNLCPPACNTQTYPVLR